MRQLALGSILLGLLPCLAAAAGPPPSLPSIVYVYQRDCPTTHTNCSVPPYTARIYEIVSAGYPPKALTSGAHDDTLPAWSPDHTRIAFERTTRAPNGVVFSIWLMNADGTGQRKLVELDHLYSGASWAWAPDGKHIAYDGDSPDGKTIDLYSIGTDGTGKVRLTSNSKGVLAGKPTWSPDGKQIVLEVEDDNSGTAPLVVVDTDGSGTATRLCSACNQAEWSPNGKRIVFQDEPAGDITPTGVYVENPDGTGLATLATGHNGHPHWSPDGRTIAYNSTKAVATVRPSGAGTKTVATGREIEELAWAPNGKELAFVATPPHTTLSEIFVAQANGSGVAQVTKGPASGLWVSWSPDSSRLLFEHAYFKGDQVAIVNPDGTGIKQLNKRKQGYGVDFPSW